MTINNITSLYKSPHYQTSSQPNRTSSQPMWPSLWKIIKTIAIGCLAAMANPAEATKSLQSPIRPFNPFLLTTPRALKAPFSLTTCPAIPPYQALTLNTGLDHSIVDVIPRLKQFLSNCPAASELYNHVASANGGLALRIQQNSPSTDHKLAFVDLKDRTITIAHPLLERMQLHSIIFELVNLLKHSQLAMDLFKRRCEYSSIHFALIIEDDEYDTDLTLRQIFEYCINENFWPEELSPSNKNLPFEEHLDVLLTSGHTFGYTVDWLDKCAHDDYLQEFSEFAVDTYDAKTIKKLIALYAKGKGSSLYHIHRLLLSTQSEYWNIRIFF